MSKRVIRIRFLSLNDAAGQPFPDVLLYLKKLTQSVTSSGSIKLDEKDPESPLILSFNETFDSFPDDEYFQVLFIESKTSSKVIADLILWRNHLLDLINASKHNKDVRSELLCSAPLERNYILKFSLRLVEGFVKIKKVNRAVVNHQTIQGHTMVIKQFKQPVYCAICNKFIWGFRRQGCKCSQCSLVTHRKCHRRIPFWCPQSSYREPLRFTGNRQFECHFPHVFIHYELPFFRSFVSSDHSYCNHCGSQVLRNALKCTICQFIIHEKCEINIPPMCTTTYHSIANAREKGLIQEDTTEEEEDGEDISFSSTTDGENENCSNSSSIDLMWLDPLPKSNLVFLPKFSDFECVGHLGNGRYGSVYCVEHIPSKEYVAIKVIDGSIEEARQQFEVERQILFRYSEKNPYVINGYCSFHQGSNLFLVMEFVAGDTMNQKIQKTRMNEAEIRYYLAEMISVLQYLHSNQIIYRDLKLEHIIVNSEGHIRLVDYGLGRLLKTSNEICHTVCGTNGYMAPEICGIENGSSGYSYAVDYWALGMMFIQMLCGEQFDFHPEITDEINYPSNLAENCHLSRHISAEARSLLNGLMENEPEKRLGSIHSPHGSLREHPFFQVGKGIDWQEIDEGVCKSIHKRPTLKSMTPNPSFDFSLPTLLERGTRVHLCWTNTGKSICTSDDEEQQYKLFDYVNQSTWSQFNPLL